MDDRKLWFAVLTGFLLLSGCKTTGDIDPNSSPAGTTARLSAAPTTIASPTPNSLSNPSSGTDTATTTYVPFTVRAGPPSNNVITVVTAETGVDGAAFTPPLTFAWAKTGNKLFVTTFGSQTCPQVVDQVVSTGSQRLTLHTSQPYSGYAFADGQTMPVCTADLSPTTSTVTVPPVVDPTKPVIVTMNGRTYNLPGR